MLFSMHIKNSLLGICLQSHLPIISKVKIKINNLSLKDSLIFFFINYVKDACLPNFTQNGDQQRGLKFNMGSESQRWLEIAWLTSQCFIFGRGEGFNLWAEKSTHRSDQGSNLKPPVSYQVTTRSHLFVKWLIGIEQKVCVCVNVCVHTCAHVYMYLVKISGRQI
jgi:hypothetical protein